MPVLPAKNVVPTRYRGVAVARVDIPLDEASLRSHFMGREIYRRTRFVVVRSGHGSALLAVDRAADETLFSPVLDLRVLAGPDECAYVPAPEVDTAIPSRLAEVARDRAPDRRAVVVQGRYEHVNFILDPEPLRIIVREVVPPRPAKLVDQLSRVLDMLEDLHPVELVPDLVDLTQLAAEHPSAHYLLPCRGSGMDLPGVRMSFLDERPPYDPEWLLLGCERSRMIHEWFYGAPANYVEICPKERGPASGALITKCCLQEEHIESGRNWVSVPWGSSLRLVQDALVGLVGGLEPEWAPV